MSQAIRNSLHSVKKYETSTGHFLFDADRTEETGHADHFWAKALATQAGSQPSVEAASASSETTRDDYHAEHRLSIKERFGYERTAQRA